MEDELVRNGKRFYATDTPSIADHILFFEISDAILLDMSLDDYPKLK